MLSGKMFGRFLVTLCVYTGRRNQAIVAFYSRFSQNTTSGSTSQQESPIPINVHLQGSIYGNSITWMLVAQHITTKPDRGQKETKGSPGGRSKDMR